tara:strand:+ start:163 stop:441 length:279 start_codon:yes stop_codon:yes gene_type:complete
MFKSVSAVVMGAGNLPRHAGRQSLFRAKYERRELRRRFPWHVDRRAEFPPTGNDTCGNYYAIPVTFTLTNGDPSTAKLDGLYHCDGDQPHGR